ncbi:hypothetical protein [Vreelandella janggokensis]|uniref:hypothetical protein n=1 Tax=Vreelandella janggokensis TaxID=370767 RepID=UPI002866D998|nr:hypothetical protein [Halomonas janggokensis]MDR5887412.1 hypothetical protein [Halomonas janggokensis]
MSTPNSHDKDDDEEVGSPNYWVEQFEGTPGSVVVPPYIRFLQGLLLLRRAVVVLRSAQYSGAMGHPELSEAIMDFEDDRVANQVEVSYETYFAGQLLINLISEVEHFFGSAISAALRLHPNKMGKQSFQLSEIISAGSTDELIDHAANIFLNKLMYEKPLDYAKKFSDILSIDYDSLVDLWIPFVELKARRDIGIHNNWVVNDIYNRKLFEAKIKCNESVGSRLRPDFSYLTKADHICLDLVEGIIELLSEKWMPDPEKAE